MVNAVCPGLLENDFRVGSIFFDIRNQIIQFRIETSFYPAEAARLLNCDDIPLFSGKYVAEFGLFTFVFIVLFIGILLFFIGIRPMPLNGASSVVGKGEGKFISLRFGNRRKLFFQAPGKAVADGQHFHFSCRQSKSGKEQNKHNFFHNLYLSVFFYYLLKLL